jgi:hypothetical protein
LRTSSGLAGLAFSVALLAFVYLTFGDTYSGQVCNVSPGGTSECASESSTLIEENGSRVLIPLAIPVIVTGLIAATLAGMIELPRPAVWLIAGGLLGFCLLTGFSIGLFFLPAALLLVIAVAMCAHPNAAHP